jgi:hypothetical protein
MRWRILRTLLYKEVLRHLANRGGIALVLLLVVAAMLLSFFSGGSSGSVGLSPAVRLCYIDYAEDGPLVAHLRQTVPAELAPHVRFRHIASAPVDEQGRIVYPHNAGAIQLRPGATPGSVGKVWVWHPGSDPSAMASFEAWFWKESLRYTQQQRRLEGSDAPSAPVFEEERSSLGGGLDARSKIVTALVLFGLFFVCVYLLPSLTCEERERGVLLAQALSPASTTELLAAKFLFYPVLGLVLAVVLAGTCEPRALTRLFFWLSCVVCVIGSMGIGLTIASLARTQRTASLGAMCYTLGVALILFICGQNDIPGLPYLALEYHGPRMLHAALTGNVLWYHWVSLAAAATLAASWTLLASILFRRRGWQ